MILFNKNEFMLPVVASMLLTGCGAPQYEFDSDFHITKERAVEEAPADKRDIPNLVGSTAELPELSYEGQGERYDVIVENRSVRRVLFSIIDQEGINLDIDPAVDGLVSLNAYGQTLDQILERIKRQLAIRYEKIGDTLVIMRDSNYIKQYYVSFPDLTRTYTSSADGSIESAGSGSLGSSSIGISKDGSGSVWGDLEEAITQIIAELEVPPIDDYQVGPTGSSPDLDQVRDELGRLLERQPIKPETSFVYTMPDAGLIVINGNTKQHEIAQSIINQVERTAKKQVLLQATVVEIALNNQYKHGIDWSIYNPVNTHPRVTQGSTLKQGGLFDVVSTADLEALKAKLEILYPTDADGAGSEGNAAANRALIQQQLVNFSSNRNSNVAGQGYLNLNFAVGDLGAAVSLLDQFGDTRVVSSPRISTLNGQPAILKVVEDNVYFTTSVTRNEAADGTITETIAVENRVIPVGFVVNVYPQIGDDDTVILSMRPSISRITGTALSPVAGSNQTTGVPIISVKELETLMLLRDGQTAVMGGLIEDQLIDKDTGVPGASNIPGFGNLFKNVEQTTRRVEYVIFVSARIINDPTIYGDYSDFQDLLPSDETFRRDATGTIFKADDVSRVPREVK